MISCEWFVHSVHDDDTIRYDKIFIFSISTNYIGVHKLKVYNNMNNMLEIEAPIILATNLIYFQHYMCTLY